MFSKDFKSSFFANIHNCNLLHFSFSDLSIWPENRVLENCGHDWRYWIQDYCKHPHLWHFTFSFSDTYDLTNPCEINSGATPLSLKISFCRIQRYRIQVFYQHPQLWPFTFSFFDPFNQTLSKWAFHNNYLYTYYMHM